MATQSLPARHGGQAASRRALTQQREKGWRRKAYLPATAGKRQAGRALTQQGEREQAAPVQRLSYI
ncbi:MAG TPA: hypothetical protein VJN90_00265 [Candidatus Acidoferrales bacterium]|nr:hypothetical protein [Candidatus Acidoferrales bacterium]